MAIETAMLMTIYLNEAMNKMVEKYGNTKKETITEEILKQYIIDGSAKVKTKIDDGFSFLIWINPYSLGNKNRIRYNASHYCSTNWRYNYSTIYIISNTDCFEMVKLEN
jgi:hypothetical protein